MSPEEERPALAAMTALPAEARAVRRALPQVAPLPGDDGIFEGRVDGRRVLIVAAGMGRAPAEAMARHLLQTYRPAVLLVAGVAGALDPSLRRSQAVVSRRVRHHYPNLKVGALEDRSMPPPSGGGDELPPNVEAAHPNGSTDELRCDEGLVQAASQALRQAGTTFAVSDCVTVDLPITTVREKTAAWNSLGAGVVDMEAYWAGLIATECGVPFLAVRVVLDRACESLPAFTRDWRGPEDTSMLIRSWALRPWQALEALLLQRRLAHTTRALEATVLALAPALASPSLTPVTSPA